MIVAERKPYAEILEAVKPFRRVLVVGCGTCVAVCLTGGEKEAEILAAQLDISAQLEDRSQVFESTCVERQCDREFLEELASRVQDYDALISLACGAGIQLLAEMYSDRPVLAGVNTTFIGTNEAVGIWDEKCRACRDCVLSDTGGICPVTLCPKGLVNGPCGGTVDGHCETDPERDCVWTLIYRRLEATGRLDLMRKLTPARSRARGNLPGHQIHPAYERRFSAHE